MRKDFLQICVKNAKMKNAISPNLFFKIYFYDLLYGMKLLLYIQIADSDLSGTIKVHIIFELRCFK